MIELCDLFAHDPVQVALTQDQDVIQTFEERCCTIAVRPCKAAYLILARIVSLPRLHGKLASDVLRSWVASIIASGTVAHQRFPGVPVRLCRADGLQLVLVNNVSQVRFCDKSRGSD
jgi:hypothetical protein